MSKKRTNKPLHGAERTRSEREPWVARLEWQVGALALLVSLAYANSLTGQFVYDDMLFIHQETSVNHGPEWTGFLLGPSRPLTSLTFHWNYLAAGLSPVSWHAINILVHGFNVVLLLLIARRHLSSRMALAAAALFAVHPLNTEVVSYVYQRSTALAALFALAAFLLFLREQHAWSAGAFGLSLLCKEETIALPIFLLAYDVAYRRRRPRLACYAALLGILGLAAAHLLYGTRIPAVAATVGYRIKEVSALSYALTEPRVVWQYLRLFLIPLGQNVDHDVALSPGPFSPPTTLPALIGLGALVGLLACLAWRRNQPAFWGLGFLILLAPTSSIVPVRDVMFEHRVYFPSICLAIAAGGLLTHLPRRALAPVCGTLVIVLLALTFARNQVWHDPKSLWSDAAEKSPHKARPWANLADLWLNEDPARARQYLERAAALDPKDGSLEAGLGLVSLFSKDGRQAVDHFQRAVDLDGPSADNLTNLAIAQHSLGLFDEAIANYRRALAIDPCMEKARKDLAIALAAQGKRDDAMLTSQLPAACQAK